MSLECKVYQKELRSLGYGLPLYEPNPADYDHVRIGDVGIADKDGYFTRIFNCFAQADHEINARYGVPEDFEPLEEWCKLTKARQALEPGLWYKSQHVHQIEGSVEFSKTNASAGMRVNFTVSSQQGAAFCLKNSAERIDATRHILLRKYMLKHFESWENFIRDTGIAFELQNMIFVTGHDLTANWATATSAHRTSRDLFLSQ